MTLLPNEMAVGKVDENEALRLSLKFSVISDRTNKIRVVVRREFLTK